MHRLKLALALTALLVGGGQNGLAQTVAPLKVVADTGYFIVKMPACTTACPDSLLRVWNVYGVRYAKMVKAKVTDTLKVRIGANNAAADATLDVIPFKSTKRTVQIPRVVMMAYLPNGTRITGDVLIAEKDSIKVVATSVYADGSTMANTGKPMDWIVSDTTMIAVRPFGAYSASAWIIAKNCQCRESGDFNAPRLRYRNASLQYMVPTPDGGWRPVTPLRKGL